MPVILVLLCWLSLLVGTKCLRRFKWYDKYEAQVYTFIHKSHEVAIMYVTFAAVLEFMYFSADSFERILSLSLCLVFNVYFTCYQLYIYYDMIKYPLAKIGGPHYEYYVTRYGSLLKNVRYVEYDVRIR